MKELMAELSPDIVPSVAQGEEQIEYVGSLDVDSCLATSSEVHSLNFDTAHVIRIGGDTEEPQLEVRFSGVSLQGESLLQLLESIAPTPLIINSTSRKAGDILDDWVLVERLSESMRDLAVDHGGLACWGEFERAYPDLKAALEPVDEFRLQPWMMGGNEWMVKPKPTIEKRWVAVSLGQHDPLISGKEFVGLFNEVYGEAEARERIVYAMRNSPFHRPGRSDLDIEDLSDEALMNVFVGLGIEERNHLVTVRDIQSDINGSAQSWGPNQQTNLFSELYEKRHCTEFMTDSGQRMLAHGLVPGFDLAQAYADRKRSYFDASRPRLHAADRGMAHEYETMELETVIGTMSVIIPGSTKFAEVSLIPAVRWSTDSEGNRIVRPLPDHAEFNGYQQQVLSSVAGHMVLAYLQPDKRANWPKELPLPRKQDGEKQKMGPAQVPLLALQAAKSLLNNDLMHAAEELATRN